MKERSADTVTLRFGRRHCRSVWLVTAGALGEPVVEEQPSGKERVLCEVVPVFRHLVLSLLVAARPR